MNWSQGEFLITDDKSRADMDFISGSLHTTYWASDRPVSITKQSIDNSVLLSLFHQERQIGFTRIVSDHSTFAWICDVFVHPEFRGEGLGKWLMECTVNHPAAQVRLVLLATKDAHGLYEKYDFVRRECMYRTNPYP